METDSEYFTRRAGVERDAAAKAEGKPARQAHLELAERYDELASAIEYSAQRLSSISQAA